jgi:hypothetical protein
MKDDDEIKEYENMFDDVKLAKFLNDIACGNCDNEVSESYKKYFKS